MRYLIFEKKWTYTTFKIKGLYFNYCKTIEVDNRVYGIHMRVCFCLFFCMQIIDIVRIISLYCFIMLIFNRKGRKLLKKKRNNDRHNFENFFIDSSTVSIFSQNLFGLQKIAQEEANVVQKKVIPGEIKKKSNYSR